MNAALMIAALWGAIAVAAGAFGAHGASGQPAEWLKTGAHYQLLHAIAALVALKYGLRGPAWMFLAGGAIFAGTLYLMALGCPRWLGAITPIGGALLIAGWLWFAWAGRGALQARPPDDGRSAAASPRSPTIGDRRTSR